MASLSGQNPSQTFPSLIKTVNNNPISASLIQLSDGNGVGFPMKISTTTVQITGSLSGTATSAVSASYAATASYVASVATASYATSALSANTASYVLTAQTASYVANTVSASRATSAANADTASYVSIAQTASYVAQAVSASYALTASYALNVPATASYALTASYVANTVSASRATSTANADTASYVTTAQTASYVLNAISSSNSVSSSYSSTSSLALNALGAISASYAQTASYVASVGTASYTPNAIITASVLNTTITFTKGDSTTFDITIAQSGSVATASYALYAVTSSHAIHAMSADTATDASQAGTAAFATSAGSSSYALSSSYAETADSAVTASYALSGGTPLSVSDGSTTINNVELLAINGIVGEASPGIAAIVINELSNGTSSIQFDADDALNLTSEGVIRNAEGAANIVSTNFAQLQWTTPSGILEPNPDNTSEPKNWVYVDGDAIWIETNVNGSGSSHSWAFNTDGTLQIPGNATANDLDDIYSTSSISLKGQGNATKVGWYNSTAAEGDTVSSGIALDADGVTLQSISIQGGNLAVKNWNFAPDGNLTIPGTMYGTASYAENAVSTSYVALADSASYAATASYIALAESASYVLSASYADSATSASYALTASYALNGGGTSINTGSFATTGSNTFVGGQTVQGTINAQGFYTGDEVRIGLNAGSISQGQYAIAVGKLAGRSSQGLYAIAIGEESGFTSQQSYAIAIGAGAGSTGQGDSAIAIGKFAGVDAQGANSIFIGASAGYSTSASNAIIISATGNQLDAASSGLFVDPIRNVSYENILFYDTASKELSYSTASIFATVSSNTFNGTQIVTGSLYISENLVVQGSSSINYISQSTLNIGTNLITVNTQNPSSRFGGLAAIDSGSSPQVSGSFLFDSINDEWIFVHQSLSGSAVTSSVMITGPETYNNVGNEAGLTANRLAKAGNKFHLYDSNISDTGTLVSVNSATQITGSTGVLGEFRTRVGSYKFENLAYGFTVSETSVNTFSALTTTSLKNVNTATGDIFGLSNGNILDTPNWASGAAIFLQNDYAASGPQAVIGFQNYANFTDNRVTILAPLEVSSSFTASLQEGAVWVGGAGNVSVLASTSSLQTNISSLNAFTASQLVLNNQFATTGSNTFSSNQTITGSLNVSNGITGSLLGTATTASYAISASRATSALSSSYALSASFATQAQGAAFATSTLTATSASYASTAANATTASYATSAQTASYVQTAQTASYILNATSASYSSYAVTASYVLNSTTLRMTELLDNVQATSTVGQAFVPEWQCAYTSSAATSLMFNLSLSAYATSAGSRVFSLFVDGVNVASTSFYFVNTNVHLTIPCIFSVENLSAGPHTIQIQIPAGVVVDTADNAHLTVIEAVSAAGVLPDGVPLGTVSSSAQIAQLGYATTGSNVFSNNQTITGSLNVSGGITGSLRGTATTASYVANAVSASRATSAATATTASFAVSSSYSFAPEIILKSKNADQTALANANVLFQVTDFNMNMTTPDDSTVTLKAGGTYELRGMLRLSAGSTTGAEINYKWYNNGAAQTLIGVTGGTITTDASWSGTDIVEALAYITVGASDIPVLLRLTAVTGTPIISATQSRITIKRVA